MARADQSTPIHVIIIDDDPSHLELLERSIARSNTSRDGEDTITLSTFRDPAEAIEHVPGAGRVVFLCDYKMPGGTGLDWLPHLLRTEAGPAMLMTSSGSEEIATRAFELGASNYVTKDRILDNPESLGEIIREASREHAIERRNRELVRELKLANETLEQKATTLKEMTETAHAFVADVAHDFRTPLSTIKEFAGIVADGIAGPVSDQQLEYLRYIDSAVIELSHMVDDFLDSAKLRAGLLHIARHRHAPDELLNGVRRGVQRRARPKRITITESIEPGTPAFFADLEKTERVLTNLLINAIKFSHEDGNVHVQVGVEPNGDGVRVEVRDEGRGIAPEDLETIFSRFQRVDTTQTERIKGFGLGLSICSQLALLNLGAMDVKSEYGAGSTFSFTLPPGDPADPARTARYYARFLTHMDIGRTVTALRFEPAGPDVTPESLHTFLTGACHPLDLVLDPAGGRVCVLGVTKEPDRWIARLEALTRADDAPTVFHASKLGSWTLPGDAERFVQKVAEEEEEEALHGP